MLLIIVSVFAGGECLCSSTHSETLGVSMIVSTARVQKTQQESPSGKGFGTGNLFTEVKGV